MKKKKKSKYICTCCILNWRFLSLLARGEGGGEACSCFFTRRRLILPRTYICSSTTSIRCTISFQSFRILLEGSFKARAPETMLIEIVSATAEVDVDVDARNEARPLRKKTFNTSASSSSREEFIFSPPRAHLSRRSFFHYYNLYKNF